MVVIRRLSADDWAAFRSLRLAALAEAPYAYASRLRDWQDAPEQRWRERLAVAGFHAIAEVEGRPAGLVSGLGTGDERELISMWAAPWARGSGVGDALVRAVVAWARSEGARSLALAVRDRNRPAIALYLRHGFVDDGALPLDRTAGVPERRMVLDLRA